MLNVVPEYAIKKCIYANLSWDVIREKDKYEELLLSEEATHVTMYTDWKQETMTSVFTASRLTSWDDDQMKKPFD